MSDTLPTQPITIFCSYTHADESYKDALKTALAVPIRNGEISLWHDRLIVPGQEWDNEIKSQLNSADIILLMVSADFFASDYCQRVEIRKFSLSESSRYDGSLNSKNSRGVL
jgi:TIR domain